MTRLLKLLKEARSGATAEQLEALRDLRSLLNQFGEDGNEKPIHDGIRSIMGAEWVPAKGWEAYADVDG